MYVVTQYPSQANRRVVKLLTLSGRFRKMVLVCEPGGNLSPHALVVRKVRNPTGILGRMGLRRLKWTLDRLVYFPSPAILYVRSAVGRLAAQIRCDLAEGHRVCLMTMMPPHEVGLIGLRIKRKLPNVFWITDWQDLWTSDEYYLERTARYKHQRVKALESQLLTECDVNVVTNPFAQRVLERNYGVYPCRVRSIPHAFDLTEIDGRLPELPPAGARHAPLRVGFLGTLFKPPKVPGERVLEAFAWVRRAGENVVLEVYGDIEERTRDAVKGREWVRMHPRICHEDSLVMIAGCDVLLLALSDLPNTHAIMHLKLPYYLMLRRPIVALVPRASFVAEVIRETGTGYVVPTDVEWGPALWAVLARHRAGDGGLVRNEAAVRRYSWTVVREEWAALIGCAFQEGTP